ncbi:MAG: hypothetical protein Kow00105_11800 [Phycisphaeraceae bacterium]
MLEGIDLAMSALERKQQHEAAETVSRHQAEVFEQISRFVQMRAEVSSDLTEALLDRMAVLASLPEQEATYHLFRGGYEAEVGRFEVAVEHYQAVLADADQASALFVSQAGSRRAGLEATRRIKALIQAHGKVVYAAFDLQAESALQDLILTGETDPQPYVELAERYPLAAVTSRARSMAAELYEQSGSSALALKQWQAVYLDAVDASQAANATERIVSTYLSLDQPVLARRWLRRVQRKYPQLLIHHAGGTVSIDSWIAELDEALSHVGSLPKLTPPLTATKWIDGQPVPWDRGQVPADAVHDRVLMRVGRELVMLASPDLRELWRCPIPSPDIKLLSMTEKQLIWWSQQAGLVGALDSRSGEALWPSIRLMDQLRSVGDPGRRPDSRTSQQREFIQLLGGVAVRHNLPSNVALTSPLLVKADPEVLVVADRLGRVICVDRMTGQVRWRILSEADGLIDVAVGEGLMALGGASWADTEAQHGLISFHDTLTGEQIGTTIQTETTPTWIEFTERGLLISADANRVAAYDPLTGRTEWRHDLLRMAAPARHWLAGDVLLRQPQQGDVGSAVVLDATNGERLNLIPIRRSPAKPLLMDARFTEQGWHILTPNQAWALDSTGQTRWSDAVCGPVGHIAMQQVSDQYVWLVSVNEPLGPAIPIPVQLQVQAQQNPQLERVLREAIQAARPADGEPARLYGLERETGRIVSETALPALPGLTPDSGVLIDGALLIGSRGRTLVISGRPADN